jgi:hypothetical protein
VREDVSAYDDSFDGPGITRHWRPVNHDLGLAAGRLKGP